MRPDKSGPGGAATPPGLAKNPKEVLDMHQPTYRRWHSTLAAVEENNAALRRALVALADTTPVDAAEQPGSADAECEACLRVFSVGIAEHQWLVSCIEERGTVGVIDLLDEMATRTVSHVEDDMLLPAELSQFFAMHHWSDPAAVYRIGAYFDCFVLRGANRRAHKLSDQPARLCKCEWAGDRPTGHDRLLALDSAGPGEIAELLTIALGWEDEVIGAISDNEIPPYELTAFAAVHSWGDARKVGELLQRVQEAWAATHNAQAGRELAESVADVAPAAVAAYRQALR